MYILYVAIVQDCWFACVIIFPNLPQFHKTAIEVEFKQRTKPFSVTYLKQTKRFSNLEKQSIYMRVMWSTFHQVQSI